MNEYRATDPEATYDEIEAKGMLTKCSTHNKYPSKGWLEQDIETHCIWGEPRV